MHYHLVTGSKVKMLAYQVIPNLFRDLTYYAFGS